MPKKNPTKPTPKKGKQPRRMRLKDVLKFIAIFIVVAVIVNTVSQYWEAHQDKNRLEKVDTKMKVVIDAVKSELGQPAHEEHTKSCSFPSLKFSRGQLSCSVSYSLSYGVESIQQSRSYTEDIKQAINKGNITKITSEAGTEPWREDDSLWVSMDVNDVIDIRCSVQVRAEKSEYLHPGYDSNITLESPLTFIFSFSCSEPTPKAFYELED